jgi:hypothetical protein
MKYFQKKNYPFVVLFVIFFGFMLFFQTTPTSKISSNYDTTMVTFKNTTVLAEVSDTDTKRILGLSGRKNLSEGEGMWFDFKTNTNTGFWMKEMNFSIDMLFLNKDFKIIYIKENATPESFPESYGPLIPYRYVLEVPSGFTKKYSISLEDTVSLQKEK